MFPRYLRSTDCRQKGQSIKRIQSGQTNQKIHSLIGLLPGQSSWKSGYKSSAILIQSLHSSPSQANRKRIGRESGENRKRIGRESGENRKRIGRHSYGFLDINPGHVILMPIHSLSCLFILLHYGNALHQGRGIVWYSSNP